MSQPKRHRGEGRVGIGHLRRKEGRFQDVPYPNYTGTEPCVGVGVEYFYQDDLPINERPGYHIMRDLCRSCPIVSECLTWALHRELHGFWAGTLPKMRHELRRQLGIALCAPEDAETYLRLQAEADRLNIPQQRGEQDEKAS